MKDSLRSALGVRRGSKTYARADLKGFALMNLWQGPQSVKVWRKIKVAPFGEIEKVQGSSCVRVT